MLACSASPANDPNFLFGFLSMKEVCKLTGYSRTHIYRLERAGLFIRRYKLGPAKIGFLRSEFLEWQSKRPRAALPLGDEEGVR